MKIFQFFKKDNMLFGVAMGVLLPLICYGIFSYLADIFEAKHNGTPIMQKSTIQVVSVVLNVLTFRIYMINLKFDKTGKGILLATFVYAILFFITNKDALFGL
ncbi:MAG: hypothetical protein Q8880_13475 [Bacteroidota bacterium]|nr:hypothetical protein [Bacteroidota bacterium]